ncbi:hypothetical protein AUC69_09845 [Methyloceanibacter superfactus]|uniref:Uncharacterized protein n=1 Tax=Methyloceanibacter superfactus TaxID=1774969 RepID=A0A1E3VZ73_9HYPH|nr:hypothetical protein [Methyloceanibacter superfactus]ODR98206.1 hypothetical protein AUC69_09845 [Methyloceanibacter superfactus]
MATNSMTLFFQGKLFADPSKAYRQLAVGGGVTAVVLVVLSLIGAPVWLAAIVGGLIGGAIQPYLFKDLKYR